MSNRIQLVKMKLVSQVSLPRSSVLCSVFKAQGHNQASPGVLFPQTSSDIK